MIKKISKCLVKKYEPNLIKVNINIIKTGDGRKKNAHETCKNGFFLYLFYDNNDKLLYVGETGDSIKKRIKGHGSGAHNKKIWYNNISYVKYLKDDKLNLYERKLLESAFIIEMNPIYNKYN